MPITTDHIHLDFYFPTGTQLMRYKYSAVRDIRPIPQIIGSYARTLTGAPVSHVLKHNGSILRFNDYQYELRVSMDQQYDVLRGMIGAVCILVDIRHCTDAENHVPYYKKVWFSSMRFLKVLSPELDDVLVSVEFTDFNTVAPI